MKREDEVICNIFRVLALKETKNNLWNDGLSYIVNNEMLQVFNKDTVYYLNVYLLKNHSINLEVSTVKNLSFKKVSKKVRKYFPLDAADFVG